jgi:hypothetical protein
MVASTAAREEVYAADVTVAVRAAVYLAVAGKAAVSFED